MASSHKIAKAWLDLAAKDLQLADDQRRQLDGAVSQQVDRLLPTLPRLRASTNRKNFVFGVPALALYQVLTSEQDLTSTDTLALLERVRSRYLQHQLGSNRLLRWGTALVARSSFLARQVERSMTSLREAEGWLARPTDRGGAQIAVDVYQCGLLRWLTAQQTPQLCPLLCDGDFDAADAIGKLRLVRTGTLAQGAACCDFRYFRR